MSDEAADGASAADAGATLRLDLWLWYARFFKSRTSASRLCASGKLRLNRQVIHKAHQPARVDDVLTFPQGREIRVVRILALAERRGPASEARVLYEDLAPPEARPEARPKPAAKVARRDPGSGRPTKAERRATERLKGGE